MAQTDFMSEAIEDKNRDLNNTFTFVVHSKKFVNQRALSLIKNTLCSPQGWIHE